MAIVLLILVTFEVSHDLGWITGSAYNWLFSILASYIALELLVFSFLPLSKREKDK
jgi:hypothetical protein